MKSKKRSLVKSTKKSSCLILDFLKHKKLPFHGAASGLALMVVGSIIAISIISIIGLIIFVPSVGAMAMKLLKGKASVR